jgi:hypothetical protein
MREQLRNVGVLALALVWGFPCAVFGLGAVIYFDEGWPERFSDLEMVIGIALSFGLWLGVMLLVGEVLERRERERIQELYREISKLKHEVWDLERELEAAREN